jgi:ABC-type transport system involved in multi-copper enzyme maturation permease subunit
LGHGIEVKVRQARWGARATPAATLESIREGDRDEDVLKRAGEPMDDSSFRLGPQGDAPMGRHMRYFDGSRRWDLFFEAGVLQDINARLLIDLEDDRQIFAGVFQHFYLRLAIFFGCLGIFMNLFRGEMLDKTLHFWFLVPARREVLLAGKYLAGLIAAVLIFTAGAMICFGVMLWPQDPAALSAFWRDHGPSHLFGYAAAAALGCVGYGSVFLAAGLLLRNPIIPAIVILLWEGVNGILPAMLQKLSVLYYVQSLTPVPAPIDQSAPLLVRLLIAPAEPPSVAVAVFGLLGVTALVLWAAARAVRRLQINYGVE